MVVCPVPVGGQVAVSNILSQPAGALDHAFAIDTKVFGVPVALVISFEDKASEGGKQRVDVIGGAGDCHNVIDFAFGFEGFTLSNDLVPGRRRCFYQVSIVEECQVLGCIGQTVQHTIESTGFQCSRREIGSLVAKINRSQQAIGNQCTSLVVSDHDNVRTFAEGGRNLEVIADGGFQFDHEFEVVGVQDFICQILKDRGTGVISPDAKGASGFSSRRFGGGGGFGCRRSFGSRSLRGSGRFGCGRCTTGSKDHAGDDQHNEK